MRPVSLLHYIREVWMSRWHVIYFGKLLFYSCSTLVWSWWRLRESLSERWLRIDKTGWIILVLPDWHMTCPIWGVYVSQRNGSKVGNGNVSLLPAFLPCWKEATNFDPATLVAFHQPERLQNNYLPPAWKIRFQENAQQDFSLPTNLNCWPGWICKVPGSSPL